MQALKAADQREGLQRLGGLAQAERTLRIHTAYPALVIAAVETRNICERAFDQGGCGSHVRQFTTWDRVYGLPEAAANDRRHDLAVS